jgi:tRNA(Ile)-lysidine synthase
VSAADPLGAGEASACFGGLDGLSRLILAVSGGPDSTALMWLAGRWRNACITGPSLLAVTIDHGLRPEADTEARQVAALAGQLGIAHQILKWHGPKPASGIQAKARTERYRLLTQAARAFGARHIATAHTQDDQAETVLFRLCKGSGPAGLAGMARLSPVPGGPGMTLVRPFLAVPKLRLMATVRDAGIEACDDASNRDPRFARPRLRAGMPALAREGLTAKRLAVLADRARRAEEALQWTTGRAMDGVAETGSSGATLDVHRFSSWPSEVALRVLQALIARYGPEGPVELGKLESLLHALQAAQAGAATRWRRTLAGASVTLADGRITVTRAPPRRAGPSSGRNSAAGFSRPMSSVHQIDAVSAASLGTE